MRLFAAIVPPPEVVRHLDEAVESVRDDAVTWTLPDAWHLTLAFYGEVAGDRVPDLTERLRRAATRYQAMRLQLTGAGRFDDRVLWIGCGGPIDDMRRLARSCEAAGRRSGAPTQTQRRFRPHVTLARARQPTDLRPYVSVLAQYVGPEWTATEIALVQSHLGQGAGRRARYEALSMFPLAS
ncbi:MAG TPA: RNA 2',3'-cyclic phosphodiesterase [Jiangellaceae bacterium]